MGDCDKYINQLLRVKNALALELSRMQVAKLLREALSGQDVRPLS